MSKMLHCCARRLLCLALTVWALPVAAAEEMRNSFWHIGMNGKRHLLKSGEDFDLVGSSLEVQLGRGYIGETWYSSVSLDIISGPYEPVQKDAQTLDYLGTGLSFWWGYNAEPVSIRTEKGNYGFSLGLSYADIVGRTVGERQYFRERSGVGGVEIVDDYVVRINTFTLIPAVFFCWLQPPRVNDNRPESLTTRIEGYLLTIGIAMPFIANYQLKYKSTVRDQGTPAAQNQAVTETRHGHLSGYSLMMSFTAMLGI